MQKSICVQAAALLAFSIGALAGSLKDIKHVVLFMQENRAFDHVSLALS
jgi:phospholipase C